MLDEKLRQKDYPQILPADCSCAADAQAWRKRRAELMALMEKYSYGKTPSLPVKVTGEVTDTDTHAYAGKVTNEKITIHMETSLGVFSFPIELFVPKNAQKPPVFLNIAFKRVPDKYIPVEEITDSGYALAVMAYKDVLNDNLGGDYSDGIAAYFGVTKDRKNDEWGKIGMWAYAASRVMDYLTSCRDELDTSKVAVIGHSRLGKTALWCAAQDERFAAAISNNSGYGGAASSKHGKGERVSDFMDWGSWDWFCENFKEFGGEKEDCKPYDQSFLLALIAPRLLCVGSAAKDYAADPEAEFLTTLHASSVWEALGKKGLVCPDAMPSPGDKFFDGYVGYHLRDHEHFISREDWNAYIEFLDKKYNRK